MRTASPIGLSLLAARGGSGVPRSENSWILLRSLRASTRTPSMAISCSQSAPSGGLLRDTARGGLGRAGRGAARAPGAPARSTCDGFECQTLVLSAAISSSVRPVATLSGRVSVSSGAPLPDVAVLLLDQQPRLSTLAPSLARRPPSRISANPP